MNLHSNKRSSSDDINERRKRRRTISNDLYRGFSVDEIENDEDVSDLSSMSSDSDEGDESKTDSNVPNAASLSQCDRCSKCKCDEVPKLLKVHNELLSLLTEMKKKNNEIHKTVRLELQICRQEIIEEVQQLHQSFTRMTDMIRRNEINNRNVYSPNSPESPRYVPGGNLNEDGSPRYQVYSPAYNMENANPPRYIPENPAEVGYVPMVSRERVYNRSLRFRQLMNEYMDDDNEEKSDSDTSQDEEFFENYLR